MIVILQSSYIYSRFALSTMSSSSLCQRWTDMVEARLFDSPGSRVTQEAAVILTLVKLGH